MGMMDLYHASRDDLIQVVLAQRDLLVQQQGYHGPTSAVFTKNLTGAADDQ